MRTGDADRVGVLARAPAKACTAPQLERCQVRQRWRSHRRGRLPHPRAIGDNALAAANGLSYPQTAGPADHLAPMESNPGELKRYIEPLPIE